MGRSSHVAVEIVDQERRVVPTAENEVVFQISGSGRILGLDSGKTDSHESYQGNRRNVFMGRALALVQSTGQPGEMRLTVSSSSLRGASVTVTADRA